MQPVRITLIRPEGANPHLVDLTPDPVPAQAHPWGWSATWKGLVADPMALRQQLRPAALAQGWDAAVIDGPLADHPPKLLVMDVDSTLITAEVIDLLAEAAGSGEQVAEITARAMAGELDFAESLTERVATLAGLPESVFTDVTDQIEFSPGARSLISAVKAAGGMVGVVSGGFTSVVQHLVSTAGIDFAAANHLEVVDGRLTGRTTGEVVDRAAKQRHMMHFAQLAHARLDEVVAVGDGANDLDMLGAAGLGVAYCAKPVAAQAADAAISFPRLDALRGFAGI